MAPVEATDIDVGQSEVIAADVGEAGLLSARDLRGEEVERLVGNYCATDGEAGLNAGVCRLIDRRKRVGGLNVAIA